MLYIMIEHVKKSTFMFPFFLGAAVCALLGGFINLFLISLVLFLGFKLISMVTGKPKQEPYYVWY